MARNACTRRCTQTQRLSCVKMKKHISVFVLLRRVTVRRSLSNLSMLAGKSPKSCGNNCTFLPIKAPQIGRASIMHDLLPLFWRVERRESTMGLEEASPLR